MRGVKITSLFPSTPTLPPPPPTRESAVWPHIHAAKEIQSRRTATDQIRISAGKLLEKEQQWRIPSPNVSPPGRTNLSNGIGKQADGCTLAVKVLSGTRAESKRGTRPAPNTLKSPSWVNMGGQVWIPLSKHSHNATSCCICSLYTQVHYIIFFTHNPPVHYVIF